MEDKLFKVLVIKNRNRKQVEITHTIQWDDAKKSFLLEVFQMMGMMNTVVRVLAMTRR